ncbi:MAG: hypothetical protein ACRD0K_04280 [Egibacteraceae bacterium]
MAQLIEPWLETADHEFTTRHTYQGYVNGKILPALGTVPVRKVDVEMLDRLYTELRKRGGGGGRPLAASTVRQIHFILRASLGLAVRWGWIPDNPAEHATAPRYVRRTSRLRRRRTSLVSWRLLGLAILISGACCGSR